MKIEREFCEGNRYTYDNLLCPKGWAQIDSSQDASYFGTWACPHTLKVFNFCEGDTTLTHCDTVEEFLEKLRGIKAWNISNGFTFSVDPGLNEKNIQRWREIAPEFVQ